MPTGGSIMPTNPGNVARPAAVDCPPGRRRPAPGPSASANTRQPAAAISAAVDAAAPAVPPHIASTRSGAPFTKCADLAADPVIGGANRCSGSNGIWFTCG